MTCDEARELLSALLDDALGPDERRAVDAHVATCVDCRRELGLLRNTVALLRGVEPARAPAGFVDRVRTAARPTPWYRRLLQALARPWPVRLSLGATAMVLVGWIVAAILRATAPELEQAVPPEPSPAVVTEAPPPQESPGTRSGSPGSQAKTEPPRAASERQGERAKSLARRDLARAAPTPPAPAPPPERQAESVAGAAAPAREGAAPSPSSSLRASAVDVSGRLVVKDREAAARALRDLVAKAGGTEVVRSTVADAIVMELTIPRPAWTEFARELAALGTWTSDREPAESSTEIRVAIRIVE